MRRKFIAGNWKMNGSSATNSALLEEIIAAPGVAARCDVAVCVPFPYLAQCRQILKGSEIALGAQDVSVYACGAYTGEISASMLLDFGCEYVIVGHSERRAYHGESDSTVAGKAAAALAAGITPIVCVGETLGEREAGTTEEVVFRQLDAVLESLSPNDISRIVVAYEPVWAIGTGKTATPEMAQKVHAALRSRIAVQTSSASAKTRILYGGSMKPENAADLMAMPDIDGGLIGGAALKAVDFLSILRAA